MGENMGLTLVFGVRSGEDLLGLVGLDLPSCRLRCYRGGGPAGLHLRRGGGSDGLCLGRADGEWHPRWGKCCLALRLPLRLADGQLCSSPWREPLVKKYVCGSRLWAICGKAKHFAQKQPRGEPGDRVLMLLGNTGSCAG